MSESTENPVSEGSAAAEPTEKIRAARGSAQSQPVAVAPGVRIPAAALVFRFDRSGGPGGQNVNKVATRATLTVDAAELADALPGWALKRLEELAGSRWAQAPERLVLTASNSRSQAANRKACLLKLRELIVQAKNRPKTRRKTRVPRGVVEKRLRDKRHRAKLKAQRRGDD